jgi:hypothetical protein
LNVPGASDQNTDVEIAADDGVIENAPGVASKEYEFAVPTEPNSRVTEDAPAVGTPANVRWAADDIGVNDPETVLTAKELGVQLRR